MRYFQSIVVALMLALQVPAYAANIPITIYRNPNCGCCDAYARYLEKNGFNVKLVDTLDAGSVHAKYAVPEALEGCHTAVIQGYVFEGLIPAEYIKRVVNERRPIKGLSVPGMPVGAPGMPGNKSGPIHVYYLGQGGSPQVFATF